MGAKSCPILRAAAMNHLSIAAESGASMEDILHAIDKAGHCLKAECELWDKMYVDPIERDGAYTVEGCSFRLNARKNSAGRIPI